MRLLLDSHVILWFAATPRRLRPEVLSAIADPENDVLISSASIWELNLKASKGKLSLPKKFCSSLRSQGFLPLPVSWEHAEAAFSLPKIHLDPFDRLIVAQAGLENLVVVTGDANVLKYPVSLLEA